jgi:hypothetical protein
MRLIGIVKDSEIIFKDGALSDFSLGQIVECHVMTARQKNHLDQAHALCNFAWHNWRSEKYKSYDEFRQFISIELGYTKVSITPIAGRLQPVVIADTWGYQSSEGKFMKRLYNPMIKFLCDYFKCDFDALIAMSQEHTFISHGK